MVACGSTVPEVSDQASIDVQLARMATRRQRFLAVLGRMAVRRLPLGLGISVAVHVTAVAWFATAGTARVMPAPHPALVQVEIVAASQPEPLAMAVTLLDQPAPPTPDVAPAVAPPVVAHAAPPSGPTPAAIRAGATTSGTEVVAPGAEPAPGAGSAGPRSRFLTMRGPRIENGLSQAWVDDMVANSKPLAPRVAPSGELSPSGGGRHHSDQGTFRVDVARDGSAKITDAPNLRVHVALPSLRDVGNGLSKWAEDPYGDTAVGSRQELGEYKSASDDTKATGSKVVGVPLIGATFDVTDALMRRHGQDPYASKKLKVLDATRDERAELGAKYRRDQLGQAPQMMKAAVDQLWHSALDVAAKKRALFELWDDCAEAGVPELVEAGQRARAFLVGFVNARLPAGSATAFSRAELAELNGHRRSRVEFAPYE
jgi:hypothetical protein